MNQELTPYQKGKVLLIDKPYEWTSFQVVNKIRYLLRKKYHIKKLKVGHAGTLDPLATGLLILCTGKFTKDIASYQAQKKAYTGTIVLGATTSSYDLETDIDQRFPTSHITEALLSKAIEHFTGVLQQAPPIFSALKKDGKRLYEYARKNQTVDVDKRQVTVYEFKITKFQDNQVDFFISCSKGTYIRSIAHDLGKFLESGAHLSVLRRTQIGDFSVLDALTVDEFEKQLNTVVDL